MALCKTKIKEVQSSSSKMSIGMSSSVDISLFVFRQPTLDFSTLLLFFFAFDLFSLAPFVFLFFSFSLTEATSNLFFNWLLTCSMSWAIRSDGKISLQQQDEISTFSETFYIKIEYVVACVEHLTNLQSKDQIRAKARVEEQNQRKEKKIWRI